MAWLVQSDYLKRSNCAIRLGRISTRPDRLVRMYANASLLFASVNPRSRLLYFVSNACHGPIIVFAAGCNTLIRIKRTPAPICHYLHVGRAPETSAGGTIDTDQFCGILTVQSFLVHWKRVHAH